MGRAFSFSQHAMLFPSRSKSLSAQKKSGSVFKMEIRRLSERPMVLTGLKDSRVGIGSLPRRDFPGCASP
jgi:hypothetical protein